MAGRSLAGALLGALAFCALACGGGGKRDGGAATPSGGTPTPTPTPTSTATPTPTGAPPASAPASATPPSTPTACAPATCGSLAKNCGAVSDGCGGNLFCGNCTEGQVCGAGGAANVCGAPAASCTPTTCAAAGASCGSVPDGCGGTLACGSCAGAQTCGGGGTANQCGAPPAKGGETRWVQWIAGPDREELVRLRADGDGNLGVLATRRDGAGNTTVVVQKRAPGGGLTWERTFAAANGEYVYPWGFAVSGGGSVFFAVAIWCNGTCQGIDFGAGKTTYALVKLASDGSFEWQKTDLAYGGVVAAGANGDVAVQRWDRQQGIVVDVLDFTGKLRWTSALNGARPLAFAPDGSLYVGWYATSDFRPRLSRLDASGKIVWTRTTPNGPVALATSGRGTPVSLEWNELAVYEAVDGAERFRVGLPIYGNDLAVQPGLADVIGAVVVGQDSAGCNAMTARKWNLAGKFLWSRTAQADGSCGGAPVAAGVVVQEDGEVVVGGTATVPTDLGQGTYTPQGAADAFLLDLAP